MALHRAPIVSGSARVTLTILLHRELKIKVSHSAIIIAGNNSLHGWRLKRVNWCIQFHQRFPIRLWHSYGYERLMLGHTIAVISGCSDVRHLAMLTTLLSFPWVFCPHYFTGDKVLIDSKCLTLTRLCGERTLYFLICLTLTRLCGDRTQFPYSWPHHGVLGAILWGTSRRSRNTPEQLVVLKYPDFRLKIVYVENRDSRWGYFSTKSCSGVILLRRKCLS